MSKEAPVPGGGDATDALGVFPVVGVGASAGGLEALTALLGAVRFDSMAFVVIQHRSPQHESLLAELLGRATKMQVRDIADGMSVEANHVYLAPAGACVALEDRVLRLAPQTSRLPIDFFFRSLAEELGTHAIGVVLSGMGSDGTFGLQAIKERGGICLVQSPETAKFDGMPRSAIDARVADSALAPEALADELAAISRHPYLRPGSRPKATNLQRLYGLLRDAFGHDLSGYKEATIERRVERRMAIQKIEKLEDYLRLAQARPEELATLYRDLLINVTSFFRDAAAFEALEETVLPRVIERRRRDEAIRVWVPACATGEEAYSIAICVLEALGAGASDVPIQVYGTDVDAEAIDRARRGFFQPNIEDQVSAERLERFFVKADAGYTIGRRVRDTVVFSVQDVVKDAPFSRMDVVSCRNLLIYMQAPLQKRVLATLHYALKPEGFLLLGTSETPGDAADLFSVVDRKSKIYEKKALSTVPSLAFASGPFSPGGTPAAAPLDRRPVASAQQLADRRLLEHYAPASLLVTDDLDVLVFRGDTTPYVSPASGTATLNVMRLVRPELHVELSRAIDLARTSDTPVREPPVRFEMRAGQSTAIHCVSIEVAPLRLPDSHARCLLIVFHEIPPAASQGAAVAAPVPQADERVRSLEQELGATKEFLQTTIEELESSNEEMKSTNEELQSANEELQSTNEELETSKEELQSINEELTTVNDELQRRVGDLARRDSDLTNVLRAVRDPVLLVGADGALREFSDAAAELLGLARNDVGRPVQSLRSRLGGAQVDRTIARCKERIAPVTEDVMLATGRWYSLTARPYATAHGTLDGAVVSFLDVTDSKRNAELMVDVSAYAEKVLPAVLHPLVMLDAQQRVVWANPAFFEMFQVDAQRTIGNLFHNLGTGQWAHPRLRERIDALFETGATFHEFPIEHDFESVGVRRVTVSGSRVQGIGDGTTIALLPISHTAPVKVAGA